MPGTTDVAPVPFTGVNRLGTRAVVLDEGGGAMADGFSVDRAALRETAQGINDTISTLSGLGFDEAGETGRGFSDVALSGLQAGTQGVTEAFGNFCGRWTWGVRSLVQDGNQFASRLGIAAGVYDDTENYLVGVAKQVTDAVVGDPHMSDQQAADASWSQDAAEVTGASTQGGDTTFQQLPGIAEQQWKPVAKQAEHPSPSMLIIDGA